MVTVGMLAIDISTSVFHNRVIGNRCNSHRAAVMWSHGLRLRTTLITMSRHCWVRKLFHLVPQN